MAYSSLAIANEFLNRAGEMRPLTAMHLQKFCYMAHGFTLALLNVPLTNDPIEAWDYGPVYPELYDALRSFGGSPIFAPIRRNNWASSEKVRGPIEEATLSESESQLVDTVWKDYGAFDAFQLSALTHEEDSPWARVYRPGVKHLRISNDLIREYFIGLTQAA